MYFIDSISLIEPERNFRLNRAELLFIKRTSGNEEASDENILIKAMELEKGTESG